MYAASFIRRTAPLVRLNKSVGSGPAATRRKSEAVELDISRNEDGADRIKKRTDKETKTLTSPRRAERIPASCERLPPSLAAVGRSQRIVDRIEIPPSAARFKRERRLKGKFPAEAKYRRSQCNKKQFLWLLLRSASQRQAKAVGSNQSTRTVPAAGSKQQKMGPKEKTQEEAIFNRRIDEGFQYYSPSSLLRLSLQRTGKYLSATAICKSDTWCPGPSLPARRRINAR